MDPRSRVLDLVAYAWAGLGAAFGPVIVASLYWSGMNRAGAVAGVLAGGLTVILWKQLDGGLFDLYEIVPGVVAAGLAIVVASRLSGAAQSAATEGPGPAGHDKADREGGGG
jgi:sodium/proline symporter